MSYVDAIERAIAFARSSQQPDGKWTGPNRSPITILSYAWGLRMVGEPAESRVVQDICDYIESCIESDSGGLSFYPGEPASLIGTWSALPVLAWGRPSSPALHSARSYLAERGAVDENMFLLQRLLRWVFEEPAREEILAQPLPSLTLRRLAVELSKYANPYGRSATRRLAAPGAVSRLFPKRYVEPSKFATSAVARVVAYGSYPTGDINHWLECVTPPMSWMQVYPVHGAAALRKLGGHDTPEDRELYNYARRARASKMLGRHFYEDGSYEGMITIFYDMLFTHAFGMEKEYRTACSRIPMFRYLKDGWADGQDTMVYTVFESALTVSALRFAQVPANDPMLVRAVDWLREAKSPFNGAWGYTYWRGMGTGRPPIDTDDSGVVSMALRRCGEPIGSPMFRKCAETIAELQDEDGWFSTWGDGTRLPNYPFLANNARAVETLLCAGWKEDHPRVRATLKWILDQQLSDGSWCDGWLARYVPGTVIAIEALLVGKACTTADPPVRRAVDWLLKQQRPDGGWGEDWYGGPAPSSAEQTGAAIFGLCIGTEGRERPREAIAAGAKWLADHQRPDGAWDAILFSDYSYMIPGGGQAMAQLAFAFALQGLGAAREVLEST